MPRAICLKSVVNNEVREKKDFICIDDVNVLLFKVVQTDALDSEVFDAASGLRNAVRGNVQRSFRQSKPISKIHRPNALHYL